MIKLGRGALTGKGRGADEAVVIGIENDEAGGGKIGVRIAGEGVARGGSGVCERGESAVGAGDTRGGDSRREALRRGAFLL